MAEDKVQNISFLLWPKLHIVLCVFWKLCFSLFFLIYFLLKDNCFIEFCCFLSNLNMNQPSAQFSSVQLLSCVRLLRPHESQHARPPCPSPTPGVHSNSCPSSRWCLQWTGWISLRSKGLSRVFSNTTIQKHQFFSTQLSSQSNSHIHTWPLEKP